MFHFGGAKVSFTDIQQTAYSVDNEWIKINLFSCFQRMNIAEPLQNNLQK